MSDSKPSKEALKLAKEILRYSDRCSLCGAVRIETGACSLIGCPDPGHDYREEQRVARVLDSERLKEAKWWRKNIFMEPPDTFTAKEAKERIRALGAEDSKP